MRVACLMMQKDESELLDYWLSYHGDIFGFENLYVFDNGSADSKLESVFDKYRSLGVNFYLDFAGRDNYLAKGQHIGKKIKELDEKGLYDFYIPLDCDEFVAVFDKGGLVSCCAKDIFEELQRHVKTQDVLTFKTQLYNSPLSKDWFIEMYWPKTFFRSGTYLSLDEGYHWGKT